MARPMARWSAYAGVSTALAAGVIVKAFAQRPNFYSAAVYLSQSSANLMILTNMLFVAACTFLLGLQKLLYGPLRPIEIEQLYDKAWLAVLETCLAMAMFRGEIGAWFLVMFFALLAGKVWAWIGEGRVEILEQQPPRNPRLFHTRLALSLGLSVVFNLSMLEFVVKEVMQMARPDMMVTFGFEFAVLSIVSLSTAARYAINLSEIAIVQKQKAKRIAEIRKERVQSAIRAVMDASTEQNPGSEEARADTEADRAAGTVRSVTAAAASAAQDAARQPVDEAEIEVEGWEDKGRWVFYLDLMTDFLKLVVYLAFFVILLIFYGLPIQILREVFMTCKSFVKRITDFIRYRNATRDMNDRYPDATEQDIGREDVCIICREEMRPYQPAPAGQPRNPAAERMRPKKLPCGHVLHFSCLRSWLERQQICPTCRTSVTPTNPIPTGQGNAAGGQAPAGQHPAAAGGGGGRAGVVRLGPLRIAFGAARGGNMLGDLQNRLRDGENQPAQAANPNANGNINANGGRQYGFGIRWDGMRRRERNRGLRSIQDQLNAAERQIQQELQSIGGSLAELQVLRNMEAELARLRSHRATANGSQTAGLARPGAGATTGPSTATQSLLVGDAAGRLGPGHPDLPAGLALPEGWTMMPLTPASGHQNLPLQGQPMFPQGLTSSNIFMPGRPPFAGGGLPTMPAPQQGQPTPQPQQASETRDGPAIHSEPSPEVTVPTMNGPQGATVNAPLQVPVQPQSSMSEPSSVTIASQAVSPNTVSSQTTRSETDGSHTATTPLPLPNWGSSAPSASPAPSASIREEANSPEAGSRQETSERFPPPLNAANTQSDSEDDSSSESETASGLTAKQRVPTVEDDNSSESS